MRKLGTIALTVAVASALAVGTAGAAVSTKKFPKNACKLLTSAQVKSLIPDADAGTPRNEGTQGVKNAACSWKSVSGTNLATLTVSVLDPGPTLTPDLAKLSLQHETGAHKVSGIGSYAIYTSLVNVDLDVKALVGKRFVDVDYNASKAASQKDTVIKLAKAVAKKI